MEHSVKIGLILSILYALMNAEVIIDRNNYYGEKGSNIYITCKSNEPIEWFYPWKIFPLKYAIYDWNDSIAEVYMKVAKPKENNFLTEDSDQTWSYKITLNLINVTYGNVGYYYCKNKAYEIFQPNVFVHNKNNINMARTYVEVPDPDHPIAELPKIIHVFDNDYCDLRVPCKSSCYETYKTDVTFKKKDLYNGIFDKSSGSEHKVVYRVPKKLIPNSRNTFTCSVGQCGPNVDVFVHVHSMMDKEKDECKDLNNCAKILSKTGYNGVEGNKLELTCVYNMQKAVNVKWELPENSSAKKENRSIDDQYTSCLESENIKLTVNNLKKSDIGIYRCIVITENGKNFSSQINITSILDYNKPHLLASVDQKIIKSHSNKTEESIVVRYVADENTHFHLKYNNISYAESTHEINVEDESSFVKNMSKKIQVVNLRSKELLVVMIRNLTIGDTGKYMLSAHNENGNTNVTFELLVEGAPVFTTESHCYEDGITKVNCFIIGYLPSFNATLELKSSNGATIGWQIPKDIKINSDISRSVLYSFEYISDLANVQCHVVNIENGEKYKSDDEPIRKSSSIYHLFWILPIFILFAYNITQFIRNHINRIYILKNYGQIGSGSSGYVYLMRIRTFFGRTKLVAIKELKQEITDDDKKKDQKIVSFMKEINLAQRLPNHENLVKFIGAMIKKGKLMLIAEYFQGCNLKDFLNKRTYVNQIENDRINRNINVQAQHNNGTRIYTTTDLLEWLVKIVRGLNALAINNFVHCDVALRNVIVCENGEIKICDFGLTRVVTNEKCKCLYWEQFDHSRMAIEVLRGDPFTEKSDVYSFGILMWEAFSGGAEPFPSLATNTINPDTILFALDKMKKPRYASTEIYKVIRRCLEIDPKRRPTFAKLEEDINRILNNEPISSIQDVTDQLSIVDERLEIPDTADNADKSSDEIDSNYKPLPVIRKNIKRSQNRPKLMRLFGTTNSNK